MHPIQGLIKAEKDGGQETRKHDLEATIEELDSLVDQLENGDLA